MKKKNWYVYILECCDETYYTGITNDIKARMKAHIIGNGSKYVYSRGFKKLLRTKKCKNRSDASKAECFVKKLPKNKKLDYFNF